MIWTQESAAWLARAYRHGSAAKTLADLIAPKLHTGARVCDTGCGVGALAIELAGRGLNVTALDISETALFQLRKRIHENPAISVRCEDAGTHTPDTPYDAMVFCFFADIHECLRMARRCCTGDVFYISRDYDRHRFSVGSHPVGYSGYRDACAALEAMQIPYAAAECALDIGQPFESFDEARRFFTLYSRDDPALITDAFLKSRLTRMPRGDYPLYLPHIRRAGMIHFHIKDVPTGAPNDE